MAENTRFTVTALPTGDQPDVTYLVRDGDGFKRVTNEGYCEAFNRGEPVFAAYDPVVPPPEMLDWPTGWTEVGSTSDIPEAFRRQP